MRARLKATYRRAAARQARKNKGPAPRKGFAATKFEVPAEVTSSDQRGTDFCMSTAPGQRSCLAIVLAAGEGTRMKSRMPKVMHEVAGRSMLAHVLAAVESAGAQRIAVVVGPGRDDVAEAARKAIPGVMIFFQEERLGTAHAVLAARKALEEPADDVIVAYADTPLIVPGTFAALRAPLASGAAIVALGFQAEDPAGYGRLLVSGDGLAAIREEKDASEAERAVRLCNAGLMAFAGKDILQLLGAIDNKNANGEYYLTDAVEIAVSRGLSTRVVEAPEIEVQGVNDRVQLAAAEKIIQRRLRESAMRGGVTLLHPDSIHFSFDTVLGRDVTVEPHVYFGPGVSVEDGVTIHAFSHLEGATIRSGASVGPYARLRPGAVIGKKAKVGNFVEIKNAGLDEGAKVSHLSYIGDASIGAGANIGAGTITCNYDGIAKHHTVIGAHAFIGSNSALVAPVTIGAGAFVASGSVVTEDVPADALAVARGRQANKPGWATEFRGKVTR
jgi:bifunctional UDP-N-acetylglucosamine pyrophosphorylase / glucosamine-1-phosphate N-acetyltransferase